MLMFASILNLVDLLCANMSFLISLNLIRLLGFAVFIINVIALCSFLTA